MNVSEEGKQQFWDEIRKQVECGENKEDRWKKTILWRAFQFSPVDQKIIKYLVDHGADIYSKNEDGETVLWIATRNGLFDLVKYFVEHGPEHNFQDDCKALQSAIQSRSLEIVKYFVQDCGVDKSCEDESGETALHHAVNVGVTDIVEYLVEQCGADVNSKNKAGWTVLHAAVSGSTLEMVKILVKQGADVNGKYTTDQWTVPHAVSYGSLELVKYLVEQGVDINGKITNGWSVLHDAVEKGTLEMIKYLVEYHANDVNGLRFCFKRYARNGEISN